MRKLLLTLITLHKYFSLLSYYLTFPLSPFFSALPSLIFAILSLFLSSLPCPLLMLNVYFVSSSPHFICLFPFLPPLYPVFICLWSTFPLFSIHLTFKCIFKQQPNGNKSSTSLKPLHCYLQKTTDDGKVCETYAYDGGIMLMELGYEVGFYFH